MDDEKVIERINELAGEEHALYQRAAHEPLSKEEHERLKALEVRLDQAWDLLHQRRARRNAGLNPEQAMVRDPDTVEGYLS
ncbi:MAG TPA: DUF2630 family protein [Actinomycetes bacterium]|nr:DUF2630 family protein [Actinomycetes bacterium]